MHGFIHSTENKNDLLKLIKTKWPPYPRFQFHIKTDNANKLADPENLYIPGFKRILEKNWVEKN